MSSQFGRVKYRKSALREVIFQVRYPSILKIDKDMPSDFQELLRQKYPLFSDHKNETVINVNGKEQSSTNNHNYQFVSADSFSKVNLTNSFVAVSTLIYDRWELFKEQCEFVYNTFLELYKPSVIQRIGLRYKDIITKSKWNLEGCNWNELINEDELGILAKLPENVINRYILDFEISSDDTIIEHRHFELVRDSLTPSEKSFLIDCDYFIQGILQTDSVMNNSELLHNHSSNFIRSVITEKLNEVMEPEEL